MCIYMSLALAPAAVDGAATLQSAEPDPARRRTRAQAAQLLARDAGGGPRSVRALAASVAAFVLSAFGFAVGAGLTWLFFGPFCYVMLWTMRPHNFTSNLRDCRLPASLLILPR